VMNRDLGGLKEIFRRRWLETSVYKGRPKRRQQYDSAKVPSNLAFAAYGWEEDGDKRWGRGVTMKGTRPKVRGQVTPGSQLQAKEIGEGDRGTTTERKEGEGEANSNEGDEKGNTSSNTRANARIA